MSRDATAEGESLSPDCGTRIEEASVSIEHKTEWCCPYCDHSLRYRPEIADVAELAIRSHMERRHPDNCDH
jgi:hypothetical protein